MSIDLPKPIAAYFAAEKAGDAGALARCFANDGVVHDEGGSFTGRVAIERSVRRVVYHQVPPKVEYSLTPWGQALCLPWTPY